MTFGGGQGKSGGGDTGGGGSSGGGTTPPADPPPPYTPTHADPSVISAGLSGYNPSTGLPQYSSKFTTLIGKAGKTGSTNKRSLIGGAW